jgi:hypothetical protein
METENPLLLNLKKNIENSKFGKNKHFKAASRYERWHFQLGVSISLLNLFIASVHLAMIHYHPEDFVIIIIGVISLFAVLLAGLELRVNYHEKFINHRKIATKYTKIHRKYKSLEAEFKDGIHPKEGFNQKLQKLNKKYLEIVDDEMSFPTHENEHIDNVTTSN